MFDSNTLGEVIIALTAGGSALGGVFAWRKTKAEAANIVGEASDKAVTRAMAAMSQSLERLSSDLRNALDRLDECERDRRTLHTQVEQLERRGQFRPEST